MFNSLRPFGSLAPFNTIPDPLPQGLGVRVSPFAAVSTTGGVSPFAAVAMTSFQAVSPAAATSSPSSQAVDPFAATSSP